MERSKKAPYGIYYNVNFPVTPTVKGIRTGHMGVGRWVKEFTDWNPDLYRKRGYTAEMFGITLPPEEEGEQYFMMIGSYEDSPNNTPGADHLLVKDGYIAVTAHNIVTSDPAETAAMKEDKELNKDF